MEYVAYREDSDIDGFDYEKNDNELCCCGGTDVVHDESAKFNKINFENEFNEIQIF